MNHPLPALIISSCHAFLPRTEFSKSELGWALGPLFLYSKGLWVVPIAATPQTMWALGLSGSPTPNLLELRQDW